MTSIMPRPTTDGSENGHPILEVVSSASTSLKEDEERAARIISRAIELSGILEKLDDLIKQMGSFTKPVSRQTRGKGQKKPTLPLLTGPCLFVLNKFFFTEYDSYESLLRLTWPREVEKNPLGKLKQRFGVRLQAGLRTVQRCLSQTDLHHELPRDQQEFYTNLAQLLEQTGQTLDAQISERRQVISRVDKPTRAPDEPKAPVSRKQRVFTLTEDQIRVLREIILGPEHNVLIQIDRQLGKNGGYSHLARDKALEKLGKIWGNPEEEARLGEAVIALLSDIRARFGVDVTFEWVDKYCHRFRRGGGIVRIPRPGETVPSVETTSPEVPPPPKKGADEVIDRRVETDDEGRTITRVILAPAAPPPAPGPKLVPETDRQLHPSQYNLGSSLRIVEALYLGQETYLGDIFPILYRNEVRDRNQALQRWKDLFQRVNQPRRRFLALMKSVYRQPNLVEQFPANERVVVRRILERYSTYRDLEIHDQNLNRQRTTRSAAVKPREEKAFEIAELDREILRATLVQLGDEKPSLDLIVISRRCRRQISADTIRQLLQPAFNQLREARSRQLGETTLGDETSVLLLNIEMAFFGNGGRKDWTVEEIIEAARKLDSQFSRHSEPIN